MRGKYLILAAALIFTALATAGAAPVLFLVRHSEKAGSGGKDPDLSAAGQRRAEALARVLRDASVTAIFTSEFKRTQETAAPLAKATHIASIVVPANDTRALVEKLRQVNGNALVVSHGNTIPELVKALGIATPVTIPEDDYSELFVIVLADQPQFLHLHYPD